MHFGDRSVQWRERPAHMDRVLLRAPEGRNIDEVLAEFYRGGKTLRVYDGYYSLKPPRTGQARSS